jgi:hypothetical protein
MAFVMAPQGGERTGRQTRRRALRRQEIQGREPIAVEPNDLPLERSGDAAEKLIGLLDELTEALERRYFGRLIKRVHVLTSSCSPLLASTPSDDTPF